MILNNKQYGLYTRRFTKAISMVKNVEKKD